MAIQDIVGVSIIGAIVGVFALMIFIARKDQAAWLAARPERDRHPKSKHHVNQSTKSNHSRIVLVRLSNRVLVLLLSLQGTVITLRSERAPI